jgi:hypothetical protein
VTEVIVTTGRVCGWVVVVDVVVVLVVVDVVVDVVVEVVGDDVVVGAAVVVVGPTVPEAVQSPFGVTEYVAPATETS